MVKEFIEYTSKRGRAPYKASTICFCLTQYAKKYIKENRKIETTIDANVRDAVLVDAINYLGFQGNCDFGLYTKDLYDDKSHLENIPSNILLTLITNHLANYIFKTNLVESVIRNNHMNNLKTTFNINDAVLVLIDFINYISESNQYDRIFTINDLYKKYEYQKNIQELYQLKSFFELVNIYTEKLIMGESLNFLFQEIAAKHDLKEISSDGKYYYTDEVSKRLGRCEMFKFDREILDNHFYALAYAYSKLYPNDLTHNNVIKSKILTMKQNNKSIN